MKKSRSFNHLTQCDRDRIHALYGNGHSQKDIAGVLGVHPSTISRELNRYDRKTWRYSALRAQKDALEKRAKSKRPGMKIAQNHELRVYVIAELKKLRSPDEIAGRMKKEGKNPRVSKNAIYKWLYSADGAPYCRYLCTRRTRKRKQSRLSPKVHIPHRISLRERPNTQGLIHTERDLFVSPRNKHTTSSGLLIVVPETKLLAGSIVENRKTETVTKATREHFEIIHCDTCLTDNGSENTRHRETGVPTYFCDKGSPWQKPHIESSIGLTRRWFLPKGINLSRVPDEIFQSQLHLLNSKYRKSLGYNSAYEVSL